MFMEQRAFGTCLLTADGKSFTLFSDVRVRRLLTSLCRNLLGTGYRKMANRADTETLLALVLTNVKTFRSRDERSVVPSAGGGPAAPMYPIRKTYLLSDTRVRERERVINVPLQL